MAYNLQISTIGGPVAIIGTLIEDCAEGMTDAAMYWYSNYFPFHFTEFAGAKYGLSRRNEKYTKKKERLMGHSKYLVYTGRSQLTAMTGAKLKIQNSDIAKVDLNIMAPHYFFMYKPGSPIKQEEAVTVTGGEMEAQKEIIAEHVMKKIKENQQKDDINVNL
jgi:hypothetical protein